MIEPLLTNKEVCKRLNISENKWLEMKRNGLAPKPFPGTNRYTPSIIELWQKQANK